MKQITNYPNHYITLNGKIFSLSSMKWLKSKFDKTNREYIKLSKNGVLKDFSVHRLMALTYLNNPENKPQVNHIDGNPSNNILYNLEWVTQSENMKHAWDTGLRTKSIKQSNSVIKRNKENTKKVIDTSNGFIYNSLTEAAIKFNIPKYRLSKYLLGKNKNYTSLKYL